jgi:flagellar hook assembly protein FlgD
MSRIIIYKRSVIFIVFLLVVNGIWAGGYKVTPSNYDATSGTNAWCQECITMDSNIEADKNQGFYLSSGSTGTITISNLKIRRGQNWKKVKVSWSQGSGTGEVNIVIKNSSGEYLDGSSGKTLSSESDSTYNIKKINDRSGSDDIILEVKLTGSPSPRIYNIQVTYDSNSLILYPSPYTPSQGKATIKIDLEKKAVVTLSIYDSRNFLVKRIYDNKNFSGFDSPNEGIRVSWNGKNNSGNLVPSGIYTVLANVKESGGSTKVLRFRFLVIR